MKYMKYLAVMFASALTLASCSTDVEHVELPQASEYKAPVLSSMGTVVINSDNIKSETVTFTCSEADFGVSASVQYTLYLTKDDKSVMAGRSFYPTITITKSDFNGFVVNVLKLDANSMGEVNAYVVASISDTSISTPASNIVTFTVHTFKAALRMVYVPGNYQGWSPATAPTLIENAGGSNIYEGVLNLTEDSGNPGLSPFKITKTPTWDDDGNWGYSAFKVGASFTSTSDGNLVLPAGIWKLSVNVTAMTIDAEKYEAFGAIGGFNGWGSNSPFIFDVATGLWRSEPLTFGDDLEFLIRKADNWEAANKIGDSGSMSPDIDGAIELLNSDKAVNIKVAGAGTYVLTVHANRTPNLLVIEKQ